MINALVVFLFRVLSKNDQILLKTDDNEKGDIKVTLKVLILPSRVKIFTVPNLSLFIKRIIKIGATLAKISSVIYKKSYLN